MGMKENWILFVESSKAKAESHEKVAQFWDKIDNYVSLVLIFLSAITTVMATMQGVNKYVVAALSGVTTMLTTVMGFLQPSKRRQLQMESAKAFRSLMLQMIRCLTENEYQDLWQNYNQEIVNEPFLPTKYKVLVKQEYTMTTELMIVIDQKEDELEAALANNDYIDKGKDGDGDNVTTMTDLPDNEEDTQMQEYGNETDLLLTVKGEGGYGSIPERNVTG